MTTSTTHRRVFDVDLEPVAGSRFQPTGFADLGAAVFDRPVRAVDGSVHFTTALLVESAQSMANHLEARAWDLALEEPVDVLTGLPYVRVLATDGDYVTSSRTDSHRLASAFVKDSTFDGTEMRTVIRDRLGLRDDRPLAPRQIAKAVFALDPFCLIHGVFFAENAKVWPGQPRIARALTAFVEATGVRRAESGGAKHDRVRHSLGDKENTGGSEEGYGTLPFHRTEWTAERITVSFVLDRAQIRSYGLGEAGTALLETVALWELRSLLDEGLRLRTACDLVPVEEAVDQSGQLLPTLEQLDDEVRTLIGTCNELLPDGGKPIEVRWNGGQTKAKRTRKASDVDVEDEVVTEDEEEDGRLPGVDG